MNDLTACCGAKVRQWHDDGGADEDSCRDCDAELCSHCAAVFEREDGYGDDGRGVRTFALCTDCHGVRGDADLTPVEIAEERNIQRGEEEMQERPFSGRKR